MLEYQETPAELSAGVSFCLSPSAYFTENVLLATELALKLPEPG